MESYKDGPDAYIDQLERSIADHDKIVAIGECGLGVYMLLTQTMIGFIFHPRRRSSAALSVS